MRKIWIILVLVVLGGGALALRSRPKVLVKTVSVQKKDIVQNLLLSGKIVPEKTMVTSAQQSGRIATLNVKEGAKVTTGDILFSLQLEAAGQNELNAMRSKVKGFEEKFASSSKLMKNRNTVKDLIGIDQVAREESDLEQLRIELTSAREQLKVVESNLGLNHQQMGDNKGLVFVRSPIDGIVTLVDKRPGDFVVGGAGISAGETAGSNERMVMIVADMSQLQVKIRVMENDIRFISQGLPVKVRLDAYPDVSYKGKVVQIAGQGRLEATAGYTYFDVYVAIDKGDSRFLPEMNATVDLIFSEQKDALSLPLSSVIILPTQSFVHIPDAKSDQGFRIQKVQTGAMNGTHVQILEGLKEGDKVQIIDFSSPEILKVAAVDSEEKEAKQ